MRICAKLQSSRIHHQYGISSSKVLPMKHHSYEAVFISKLTCQLSPFFVQSFAQKTSTLCKTTTTLCKTTSTLGKERRQLCTNNVHTLYKLSMSTLYEQRQIFKDNVNFVQTTTTLCEQRQLCKDNNNFVRIMFSLCLNSVNFVQTMSTLSKQHQLCKNNVIFVRTTSTLVRTGPNPQ